MATPIKTKRPAFPDGPVTVWRKEPVLEDCPDDPGEVLRMIGDHLSRGDIKGLVTDDLEFESHGHVFRVSVRPVDHEVS